MAQLSFHCANSRGYLLDRRVSDVADLLEARDYARAFARSLSKTSGLERWNGCRIHVLDQRGKELFVMPLPWAIGGRNRHEGIFGSFWKKVDALELSEVLMGL
jgi:hypothetical protein